MRKSGGQIEENLLQPHLQKKKQRIIEFLDEEEEQERDLKGKKTRAPWRGIQVHLGLA